ncbi:MAG: 4,5-dihydroxyphthalate decarboxylase [Thermodesulfobacteriota bacterium]|nr:4,5-dihydroxyphthalate decarboxylase [Thermodesulfobacteriota bacterium]
MAELKITMALSLYDRHVPFFDGTVLPPENMELKVLQVGQSVPLRDGADRHERMISHSEFDICELSLSSYLMAKSRGMPFTAVPVFPRRLFSQSQMYVNVSSGIQKPEDLIGRKVGLSSFQTTLSVLAKGDLRSEYGVPWQKIKWFVNREESVPFLPREGTFLQKIDTGKKIGNMIENGEIDALFMPHPPKSITQGSDNVRRLFQNVKEEELRYYRKNGFYPIMHVIALKQGLVEKHPWVAGAIMNLFEEAKKISSQYYDDPNWSQLAWGRHFYEEQRDLLGADLWPSGISKNRANLERFIDYSYDQGLIDKAMEVESLFANSPVNI